MNTDKIWLSNKGELFMLTMVTSDETGPVHGLDCFGRGYSKCDTMTCDHTDAPEGSTVWHDDENTETFWQSGLTSKWSAA